MSMQEMAMLKPSPGFSTPTYASRWQSMGFGMPRIQRVKISVQLVEM